MSIDKLEAGRHWAMDQAWDILAREQGIDRQRYTMESAPTPLYVHAMFAQQYAQKLAVTTAKSTSHCMHVQPKHTTRVAPTSAGKQTAQDRGNLIHAKRWVATRPATSSSSSSSMRPPTPPLPPPRPQAPSSPIAPWRVPPPCPRGQTNKRAHELWLRAPASNE